MNHRVSERMRGMVESLHHLRDLVEARLQIASAAARDEWSKLHPRIPSLEDLSEGWLETSEADLMEMRGKVARFAEILHALGAPGGRVMTPSNGTERARRPS
jgi:hypothetical protein